MKHEKLRDEVLAAIAQNGRCYTNEARYMALELIKFRADKPKTPRKKKNEPTVEADGGGMFKIYWSDPAATAPAPKPDPKPDKVAVPSPNWSPIIWGGKP